MAEEPDNLILRLLREIREKLDEQSDRFAAIDRRFDRLEKRFDEMRGYMNHALGMGMTGHLKNEEQDTRQEDCESRQKQMEELFR
ncbi:MAG: hypothetical protein KJZ80_13560 [Hyphomicrobiaceae bacterium]|nr:hypothetical protein [Hyphomicrobiaceae bacterium]